MTLPHSEPEGRPTRPPPRTHGTPSGYRNIRVLVPTSLHFRLAGYAALSHASIPESVSRWLTLVTPLDPITGQPLPANNVAGARGHGQGSDADASPGPRPGPGASPMGKGAAPGPATATPGPSVGPQVAHRPGAAHSQGASASSTPNHRPDPSPIGSSPTVSLDRSSSGRAVTDAEAN